MRKCSVLLTAGLSCIALGVPAWADTTWTSGGDGTSWTDGANWDNGLPNGQRRVFINGVSTVNIDPTVNDTINRFILADAAGSDDVVVNMTGGSIDISLDMEASRNLELGTLGNATLHMSGGAISVAQHLRMAPDPSQPGVATLRMDGGAISVGSRVFAPYGEGRTAVIEMNDGVLSADQLFLADGVSSSGTLEMTGGTLNAGDFWMPTNLDAVGSTAHLQLDGGIINVGRTFMLTNDNGLGIQGTLDITNGKMILAGDMTADPLLNGYINDGFLTAFGGGGTVVLNYVPGLGTEVYAVPEPAALLLLAMGGLVAARRKR